jgi:hypothetical protein
MVSFLVLGTLNYWRVRRMLRGEKSKITFKKAGGQRLLWKLRRPPKNRRPKRTQSARAFQIQTHWIFVG